MQKRAEDAGYDRGLEENEVMSDYVLAMGIQFALNGLRSFIEG